MAYDERLSERVRAALARERGVSEKKMFGGLSFLLHGNMCCGVAGEKLVLRLGPDEAAETLKKKHTKPMDFTGKPLKSMVYVMPAGTRTSASVKSWVSQAVGYAAALPKKAAAKKK